ncbi:MAG TPA: hypothetical protein VIW24_27960 [Aldersonia sp.]
MVTTRPTGYVENIAPSQFERIDLSRLDPTTAVRFGMRATRVRLKDDHDKIDRIERQLKRAADTESLRNLMQTPLQVLIMTIIVESAGPLSPDRYSLFWTYFETVFKRERSKAMPFARLLQEHGPHILDLHQRVGFELQVRSETSDGAMATMLPHELRAVGWQVLSDAGFQPSDTDAGLLDNIVTAATHRLVLLAPHGAEGLGFDVRSLQELMAARFLTTGTLENVTARLETTAASPHWRNGWVFAAGRYFAEPQAHQHEAIVDLVERIDRNASHRLGLICPVGPILALDLVDDGMARSHPRFHDRLLKVAFRALEAQHLPDPLAVARVLVRAADTGDRVRDLVSEAIRNALGGNPVARETTGAVQKLIPVAANEAGVGPRARSLDGVRGKPRRREPTAPDPAAAWNRYAESLAHLPETDEVLTRLAVADDALRKLRAQSHADTEQIEAIMAVLSDRDSADILEVALEALTLHEPKLVSALRDGVMPAIHRAPVGELLKQAATTP